MKNASTVFLAVMMFSSLGLWGCTHQQNGAYSTKIRELEARYTKLEEDYKAVVHAGDQLRKKVGQLESQRTELSRQVAELQGIAKERDELRTQVTARTSERDHLQNQIAVFRKDVHELLGRMDTALQGNGVNATPVSATPASRTTE
jgi:outer membrane murein-binding lipoprotein Lpp